MKVTMPDGSTEEIAAVAGDAISIPGGQHLSKNKAQIDPRHLRAVRERLADHIFSDRVMTAKRQKRLLFE